MQSQSHGQSRSRPACRRGAAIPLPGPVLRRVFGLADPGLNPMLLECPSRQVKRPDHETFLHKNCLYAFAVSFMGLSASDRHRNLHPWGLAEKAARGWTGGTVLFCQMVHNLFAAELNSDRATPCSSPWRASQKNCVGFDFFDGPGHRHRRRKMAGSLGFDVASRAVVAGDFSVLNQQRTGGLMWWKVYDNYQIW